MSVTKVTRADGSVRWEVRWYESGRNGARRKRTFDKKKDADYFEASLRRQKQLGQLAPELLGSTQTLADFAGEWWDNYAVPTLAPNTLANYPYLLDRWLMPYLGDYTLRELTRETIDAYKADIHAAGAGAPTANRALAILQGILHRAVEWNRLPHNPVVGVRRLPHTRDDGIDARTPEEVEAIRFNLGLQDAAFVGFLGYEGPRPGELLALLWSDVLDRNHDAREHVHIQRALSDGQISATKSGRSRQIELFEPVACDLVDLYLAQNQPALDTLVFPNQRGGYLNYHNWRERTWRQAIDDAGLDYFRPYDLRHTCATLLIYSGWIVNEVAEQLGHNDPGFTARTYQHTFKNARKRRGVSIEAAIAAARTEHREMYGKVAVLA